MKILPFKIPKTSQESFHLQEDHQEYFYDNLHQHPEVQLTSIIRGEGKIIVGDYIGGFKPGDVFLIGPNLPHVLRNDPEYSSSGELEKAHCISVFFEWNFLGEKFMMIPEVKDIIEFAIRSENGLKIRRDTSNKVSQLMHELFKVDKMNRLIVLLQIIDQLSNSHEITPLASAGAYHDFDEIDGKRLDSIYRFTIVEYHRQINLKEVAEVSNMTVNSFCRYFKKRTRKPYMKFLTEIRIAQACRLLQQDEYAISQICMEVGFNNLSNFNRKFKEIKNCTPTEFKQQQVKETETSG